jgi:hypothetical protein
VRQLWCCNYFLLRYPRLEGGTDPENFSIAVTVL